MFWFFLTNDIHFDIGLELLDLGTKMPFPPTELSRLARLAGRVLGCPT